MDAEEISVSIRRRPRHYQVRLHGMQDSIGLDGFDGLIECHATMKAEPLSGVSMPLDVEVAA